MSAASSSPAVDDGKRLMDTGWVKVQQKTFTKWANNHMVKTWGSANALSDLEHDFDTGERLMQLVNSLYGIAMPVKYNKNPKMRPHKLDNVTMAMDMLEKQAGVKTNFLKTTHLVDHDLKMILGMIWAIILHYQIQGISVEEMSAKEGLLLWCQKKTKGYNHVDPPTIRGFTTDWQNGLAFCALIHKHRPDLLDYASLDPADARGNLEKAFSIAEKQLGIPRLLDIEDLVDVARPDERSVITYVSEYFHRFASQGEAEGAGKRIAQLVANARANDALKAQYNHDATALREWIVAKTAAHQARDFGDSLDAVEAKWADFAGYKKNEKPPKTQAKLDLEAQFATLQTKLRVQGRPAYAPPSGLAPSDIDALWTTLGDAERERAAAIRAELERQQRIKALVDRFTRRADALDGWAASNKNFLTQSDVGRDLASCNAHLKTLEGFEADFAAAGPRKAEVLSIGNELIALRYSGAATIKSRIGALDTTWSTLRQQADARRKAVEAELARQQKLEDLRLAFGKQGRVFINWVESADVLNEAVRFNTLEDADAFEKQFDTFQREKATQEREYNALVALAAKLKQEGVTSNVYAVYTIDDITSRWQRVLSSAAQIAPALQAERERLTRDDELNREFAAKASEFSAWADAERRAIQGVSGASEAQIAELSEKQSRLHGDASRVDELAALDHALAERGVLNNPHTSADVNSLKLEYDGLVALCHQQIETLEREQAKSKEASGVDAAQVAEFKEMFNHFDKDSNNQLEKHEFKACLSSLGVSKTDAEIDGILKEISGGRSSLRFDEFLTFMSRMHDRSDTASNMREAFKTVAGGKSFVTEADLRAVMDSDTVSYLLSKMSKGPDGYSYAEWCNAQYA